MNNKNHRIDKRFGILLSVSVTFIFVIIGILNKINYKTDYRFFVITDKGDISGSFSMIVGIISTFMAVYVALYLYRRQKNDAEKMAKQKQNEEKLNQYRNQLNTIIQPLRDNIRILRDSFDLFKQHSGPYILEFMRKKDLSLTNIEIVLQRYAHQSSDPQYPFIELIESLRQLAVEYPKTQFSMFTTETVVITDCSKCEEIYDKLVHLLSVLENESSKLERNMILLVESDLDNAL